MKIIGLVSAGKSEFFLLVKNVRNYYYSINKYTYMEIRMKYTIYFPEGPRLNPLEPQVPPQR